jgi:RNA polymerase sigma-32 factor
VARRRCVIDAPVRTDGDAEWMDLLVDESASQESQLAESEQSENRRKALGEALTVLDDRERRIFATRRLADEPITLGELADELGVSRERIRQIEVGAFEKVQKVTMSAITAMERPYEKQLALCQDQRLASKENLNPFSFRSSNSAHTFRRW